MPDALKIRLLGTIRITRADEPLVLPQSQKTRALLAYLVLTQRGHRRDTLCDLLWDVTDDPRGALRWSLSKLRVLDDEHAQRIIADRNSVSFSTQTAWIDALELRQAAAQPMANHSLDYLRELSALFRGDLLEDIELSEFDRFRAWRVAERERFREIQRAVLHELVARLVNKPEQALDPARALVRLSPHDTVARSTLIDLLNKAGRQEEAQEHYSLARRQIERDGGDPSKLAQVLKPAHALGGIAKEHSSQVVRFCRSSDATRIAYASVGSGPPLVKTANWLTHLEFDWKSPLWRHLARDLAKDYQLIRYDQRGTGLSDRTVPQLSLDAFVNDLEAVVAASGLSRFPLLGISQGCRVAIAYAVKHPEQVSHLILYGGSARGWKRRDPVSRKTRGALQALIEHGWGQETHVFRQVFTTLFMPSASAEQTAWFNELQRASCSPSMAYQLTEITADIDVSPLLSRIAAPVLVMHARGDAMAPFEEAVQLAAGISDARFVALESDNHLLLDDEPAFARFLSEIRNFLAV